MYLVKVSVKSNIHYVSTDVIGEWVQREFENHFQVKQGFAINLEVVNEFTEDGYTVSDNQDNKGDEYE